MSPRQRIALGISLLTITVLVGYIATAPNIAAPVAGSYAPAVPLEKPQIIGIVAAPQLATGPVVAIAQHGADAYLLQNHTWLRVRGTAVAGPFGAEVRGGRGWIASGAAIGVTDSVVLVLDRLAKSLHQFRHDGEWIRAIPLSRTMSDFTPERMAVERNGTVFISGFRSGNKAGWSLVLLRDTSVESVFHRASTIFAILHPLILSVHRLAVVGASEYDIVHLSDSGSVLETHMRHDPPRVALTRAERGLIENYLRAGGAAEREGFQMPEYAPAVAHAFALTSGNLLVAVAADEKEAVFIEEISRTGKPLRTLMRQPVSLPIGFSDSGIVMLREETERTLVERYVLPRMEQ